MKILVVLNASGGAMKGRNAAQRAGEIRDLFADKGVAATVVTLNGGDITPLIRASLVQEEREGRGAFAAVVVGGGDGSVSAAASAIVGRDVPLGVLPLGTLNHFAKDLGLPLDIKEAVAVIASGRVATVDAGEVNGRIFVNNASLGIYPHLVEEREKVQRRGIAKWLAAGAALVRVLWRMPTPRLTVRAKGWKTDRRTPCLFIGNNLYDLDVFASAKRARLDQGELCLYIATRSSRAAFLRLAARTLLGRMEMQRDLELVRLPEVEIAARSRLVRVALDGEAMVLPQPLKFRSRPGALKVFAREGSAVPP